MADFKDKFSDLGKLICKHHQSQKWVNETKAKPTKVALWVHKQRLEVCTVYWEGTEGGKWEDENLANLCSIIYELP